MQGKGTSLQQRLEQLTHAAPIMLFMKGDRDQPRCGFSARVVAAIQEAGVPFQTFDILTDESVRQGLKVLASLCMQSLTCTLLHFSGSCY